MKDLDFDELDKAVNSLLGDKPKVDDQATTPAEDPKSGSSKVLIKSDEDKPAEAEVEPQPKKVEKSEPKPEPKVENTPKASLIVKRPMLAEAQRTNGKFIDVVQPPQPKEKEVAAPAKPVVLKPLSDNVVPDKKTDEPAKEELTGDKNTQPQQPAAHRTDWPDPLDFHGFKFKDDLNENPDPKVKATEVNGNVEVPKVDAKPEPAKEKAPELPEVAESAETKAVEAPQEPAEEKKEEEKPASPFLPQAKVEKRPLGAFSSFEPEAKPQETPASDEASKPAVVDDAPKPVVAPPELAQDIVAVEAGAPVTNLDEDSSESKKSETPKQAPDTKAEASVPTAMASIPQQYRSDAKPVDNATRPIFDTKEYHPPLHPEAHKHSKVVTIINVILVLILITALAVAAYYAYTYF